MYTRDMLAPIQKPDRGSFAVLDFQYWRDTGVLSLTPKFQRRGVWNTGAKSFFIDTLLRGMPVPPIFIRVQQNESKTGILREVIDGQQRITAVLDFLDGKFRLSKSLNAAYAGKSFTKLSPEEQDRIRQYPLLCEVFHGVSDAAVLAIFARLNTYSVQLNDQELRNGTYFGYFKQAVYELALEHINFWRRHKLFTERSIARMLEAELTSELLIALLDGMQDKKKSISGFYKEFDEEFPRRDEVMERLRRVLDEVDESFPDSLTDTEFTRVPLFYTLFCAIAHRMFGIPRCQLQTPRRPLTKDDRENLRAACIKLSDVLSAEDAKVNPPKKYAKLVLASSGQTDNIQPRQARLAALYGEAW